MDLETLEALALADNRAAALSQLLPGSEDHDYFRCLHAQHRGALGEADQILEAWPDRHGSTERYQRMRIRQDWYRLGEDPARVADEVRDRFGVSHWHEADAPDVDTTRVSRLPADTFSGERLLDEAVAASSDLSQVTDEGLYELLGRELDPSRRRTLLARIDHTQHPALVQLVADDLAARGSSGFGSIAIHHRLTIDQLLALAQLDDKLRTSRPWVEAVVRRMQPPASVDIELDREARAAHLTALWELVRELPPVHNSLKAHVLWHLLDTRRRLTAQPDTTLLVEYLQLPRAMPYAARELLERARRDEVVQPGADYSGITGLPPAGDDEALVRDLVHRKLGDAEQLAPWLDRHWLDAEVASAQLLYGTGNAERATQVLGPTRAAALRERVDLEWCVHNPTQFALDEPLLLDVDLKNVTELVVKVFRIDPLAYFQLHRREITSDADLDGLAASQELVLRFDEPPIRRHRRRIDLPMCRRAGTYVIDLIGNGMSSRAVIHKGRLRHVSRVGAAGRVVTIFDEQGRLRADARAWIGDREYVPDENGSFSVPFSTAPAATPMLLAAGDLATVDHVPLVRESYQLVLDLQLDRQALTSKNVARAIARVQLTVAGAPASLALLEQPRWEITLVDRAGLATTKELPLALADDDAAVLDIPLGELTGQVTVHVRGKVRVVSEQRDEQLAATRHVDVATMQDTLATEALYLARTSDGWVISALGRTGEPRAQRPLTISLAHRWAHAHLNVELATDARGRCELGELAGIARISATLAGTTQTWHVAGDDIAGSQIQTKLGRDVVIGLPASRDAGDVITRASLVETRRGVPVRQAVATVEPLAGAIVVRGLAPGEFLLRAPGLHEIAIRVAPDGRELAGHVVGGREIVELSRTPPAIAELAVGDALRIRLAGTTQRTRVHVIATQFFSSPIPSQRAPLPPAGSQLDRPRPPLFVSGRELGDEYRYVLDRRNAKRFPNLLLDKPSLLLNPWARRTTTTGVAMAAAGRGFGAAAPAAMAAGYAGPMQAAAPPHVDEAAYAAYDFVADPPRVLANLVVDAEDSIGIPLAELGNATCVTVIVDDPAGSSQRRVALPEQPLAPRDLRLGLALDPGAHVRQHKTIVPLRPGDALVVEDLATAKIHLLDSVERAHAYLLSLRDDATLREFSFVTRWHALADTERRALYSKYACHELHLFLYFKDRAFFDAVVRPYLAHKRTKTFVDHWLLHADLTPYLEPWRLGRLSAVERALLAQRMLAEPALARTLADEVSVLPPDPERDTRIIDALLGGAAMEPDSELANYAADALSKRMSMIPAAGAMSRSDLEESALPGAPPPAPRRRAEKKKEAARGGGDDDFDDLDGDLARRRDQTPMYRVVDRTQEWAENDWWHLTPQQSNRDHVLPNRFWRDFARHKTDAFLSPWLGLATDSFAEAMCALAVTELPFVAGTHQYTPDGARLTIHAGANALCGSAQLVPGELVDPAHPSESGALQAGVGAPLVVGQSYVRADDRYRYVDGEQIDKYVDGPFIAGVVYTCQVVLANPSSSRQRVAALVQIPRGSIALAGAQATQTLDVALDPYGTHGHEYSFYFPAAGRYTHFGAHVSRGDVIVAAAAGHALDVTDVRAELDPQSWAHISQHGALAQVVAFLDEHNLADVELARVAWRLRDRDAYEAIVSALERRRLYDATLWGYSLLHLDAPRMRVWVRALDAKLVAAGPALDMPIIDLDAEAFGVYEHLELAPLVNARAHRLGAKLRILNDGLAAQYRRFLELVAHRRAPTSADLLAAAHYLLAQDRVEPALGALARVDVEQLADRMQHDYLAAYAACLVGDAGRARDLVSRWQQHPVDRWRFRFDALASMLDEVAGAAAAVADPNSRDQRHADLAAQQPAFELTVDRDGIVLRQQHVSSLELRFFEMDAELLFSRQPFVQSDVSRFSFIEPGHREVLQNPPPELRLPWPLALRGKNVVVEGVGAGQRTARIHYANDLATQLAHQYGQLRVQRASDGAALPATYVKVYAQKRGGTVAFYKDGYTDLRGWFDYATLSTSDLDVVERFAILVASDQAGSAIVEAAPPAR